MSAEMKKYVIELLETYHDRERMIAVLRYELEHPDKISGAEQIEAMTYGHGDGIGGTKGHISNKTLYIALNYEEQAERLNTTAIKEIAEELGTTDRLLFEVNVDEVLTIAKGLEGGDKSKLIHDISDDWYIADCAMKAYLADLAKYTFTDVPDDIWYAPYVKSAARSGLVKGKAEGVFAPDASMTIAEAVTLAARFEAALYEEIDPAEGNIV